MNKIKKVFTSIGVFFIGLISKVYAVNPLMVENKYGVFDPRMYETKYGIFEPKFKILSIGKLALPFVLFFIGLFVVLSKKITKKVKITVVSILFILAILGYVLMNYIATNF